jgi:hypothetical protein
MSQYADTCPIRVNSGKFPPKTWQNASVDYCTRVHIMDIISEILLTTNFSTKPFDWVLHVPDMAKRLEEALYYEASSLQEYSHVCTVNSRLKLLADSMRD